MHTTSTNLTTGETVVVPFTAEQESEWMTRNLARADDARDHAAARIRAERDAKLMASDWRVIKALEGNKLQEFEWVAYRQELRDITKQPGFPDNIIWPVEP